MTLGDPLILTSCAASALPRLGPGVRLRLLPERRFRMPPPYESEEVNALGEYISGVGLSFYT